MGERTAEDIKMKIGCVYPQVENTSVTVRGRNAENGLPMEIEIYSKDVMPALRNDAMKIVNGVMEVLEKAPPELVQDISNKGIYLTGGGSLLSGLDKLISEYTSMNVMVADDAISCVAIGIGKAISSTNISKRKKVGKPTQKKKQGTKNKN